MRGGDEGSRGYHGGRRRRQHLVDQRGLEGPFDAAADQVTQRDLEHVLTRRFTWEEETDGNRRAAGKIRKEEGGR